MALYAPPFWSPYDHPYNIFDKMHPYSHPYQQYPMYRVPPVYHPLTPPFAEQTHSPGKYGTTSPSSHPAEALKSPKRRTVCREKSSQVDRQGETERTVRDDRSRPSIDAQGPYGEPKTTGSSRRDATPESTGSESPGDTPSYCRVLTFQDQNGQSREMVFPKALDLDRPKRARTSFTLHQLERLEKEFKSNQYMVGRDRAQLAKNLDLTEIQVKVWYQNRRTKFKREQCRAAEFQEKNAESFAACNILRLLHNRDVSIAPSVGPVSPRQSRLPSW